MDKQDIDIFEQASPRLTGLAYRLLGSAAEAEDVVQDVFLKWQAADKTSLHNAQGWLTTCCTNLSLDVLKSARRSRTSYVGPWLPEPLHTTTQSNAEEDLMLSSSLSTAFLFLLERLTPKERAAYLLHEIFDYPYEDISQTLGVQSAACRKLVSRARKNIGQEQVRNTPTIEQQNKLLAAFENALKTGSAKALGLLLSEDIELRADGGGKVIAARNVIYGRDKVLRFITGVWRAAWKDLTLSKSEINGRPGLVFKDGKTIHASLSFGYDEAGVLENIFIMRNPDKLSRLENVSYHSEANGGLNLARNNDLI